MFVAAIVKKPDHQILDSIDSNEINEVEKKMLDLCAPDVGESLLL